MLTFLLVIHAIITAILVVVILMQRSEGGGLGMGGSPTGLMSARGAADFLTRATTILATLFVLLSIASAVVASRSGATSKVDTSLQRTPAAAGAVPPPAPNDPLAAVAGQVSNGTTPAPVTTPVPAPTAAPVPKATQPATKASTSTRPTPRATNTTLPPTVTTTTTPAPAPKAAPAQEPAGPANSN